MYWRALSAGVVACWIARRSLHIHVSSSSVHELGPWTALLVVVCCAAACGCVFVFNMTRL